MLIVQKFGGTSVSTRPRWETIARIAAAHRARGRKVLIVVSALWSWLPYGGLE